MVEMEETMICMTRTFILTVPVEILDDWNSKEPVVTLVCFSVMKTKEQPVFKKNLRSLHIKEAFKSSKTSLSQGALKNMFKEQWSKL